VTYSPTLDIVAIVWFFGTWIGYQKITSLEHFRSLSIAGATQIHRRTWMNNMARRDNRVLDMVLINGLGQGNAFFASTSVIAVGGLTALLGAGDKVQPLFEQLPFVAHTDPIIWQARTVVMIAIFIYAFFKYAWAYRLSQYTAILIGATPLLGEDNEGAVDSHVARTAQLAGIAAEHANMGLRSFYYAIAAFGWMFHPLVFIAATTWVLGILVRRDFFSRSKHILSSI